MPAGSPPNQVERLLAPNRPEFTEARVLASGSVAESSVQWFAVSNSTAIA